MGENKSNLITDILDRLADRTMDSENRLKAFQTFHTLLAEIEVVQNADVITITGVLLALLVEEDNDVVRTEAVRALGVYAWKRGAEVRMPAVLDAVIGRLVDPSPPVRVEAVMVLAQLAQEGDEYVITAILGCLRDEQDLKVRDEAAKALAHVSGTRANAAWELARRTIRRHGARMGYSRGARAKAALNDQDQAKIV